MINVYKNSEVRQVSINFNLSELKCKCGKCAFSFIDSRFVYALQTLRNLWGKPLILTCGYRCQEHNRSLKDSVFNSYHQLGLAVDLVIPYYGEEQKKHFLFLVESLNLYYYINEDKNFIHVDGRLLV